MTTPDLPVGAAPVFRSVLVANRGEIAVRVLRTCRRLGIRTIAVYSDADAGALHVGCADEAYRLGPAPASESYLDAAAILRVAREAHAEALHPGYGFLSENPDFAQAVLDAGVAWIGPPPAAMRALGDKARAKALAERTGVPVLPGYHGEDQQPAALLAHARAAGFPLLIKASAGGGGRGMRVVEAEADFLEALESARREANASFGDDRVLLERYVPRPRHVEVQVFGDCYGRVVALGERECSIQRRHQKLVEESPSPAVDDALRARLSDAARALARAAGYTNAGTVEFLLAPDGAFFFLEVNARLQVEHPVTEMVTGLDLVQWQLEVAAGHPIAPAWDDAPLNGHAIEVRVIAEDPAAGFLPSAGRLDRFCLPEDTPGVRVDTGFATGDEVSPYYDSLLAKVIVQGATRLDAADVLAETLARSDVVGVASNLDLLQAIAQDEAFRAGALHTRFLEERRLLEPAAVPSAALVAAAVVRQVEGHPGPGAARLPSDPWRSLGAWRLGRVGQPSRWLVGGEERTVRLTERLAEPDRFEADLDGEPLEATILRDGTVRVGSGVAVVEERGDSVRVRWQGRVYRLTLAPATHAEAAVDTTNEGGLTAPMPGRIVKLAVAEGEAVQAGQTLAVLEAMKMEHTIQAPRAGVIRRLLVAAGDQVAGGALLVEMNVEGAS